MNDLRVVSAKILLKVVAASPIRGFVPQSIMVVGKNFDQTTEVQYNGILAEEFVIASSTRLIVRIPPSQVGKKFTDLKVLAPASATKSDAVLSLGMTAPIKSISGIDRLVQNWVMVFFTTPGTDIFSPESGGGGASLIGRSTDRSGTGVTADLSLAIEKTKQELIRIQSNTQTVPPSEKLLSSSLEKVEFDEKTTVLSARVNIQNMLGDVAEVSLG